MAEQNRRGDADRAVVTMRDVAQVAGVSQSTVSRVLNDTPTVVPIAPETRERVLAAASSLHYSPNPLARGLRGGDTMLLGVIVREITDLFFASAIEAVSTEAMKRGYNVVLGHAHGRADEAMALRSVLETRHCDAILLLGDMSDQPRLLESLKGGRARVVGLWQGSAFRGLPIVGVDNRAGIRQVMDHLIALGHRRIAFAGTRPLGDIEERQTAFMEKIREAGLALPDEYLRRDSNGPEGGMRAVAALMELPDRPTAIVCSTDQLAIGVLSGAARHGLRVPEDLSVTGFDDLPLSGYLEPALTTVRMPIAEMAVTAVAMAIDPDEGDSSSQVKVFDPWLVVRGSTQAPPADPGGGRATSPLR